MKRKLITFLFIFVSLVYSSVAFAHQQGRTPFLSTRMLMNLANAFSNDASGNLNMANVNDITLTGDLNIPGSILVNTGILTLGGTGNTNNENWLLDFETTASRIRASSSTSAKFRWDMDTIYADGWELQFGSSSDVAFAWETIGKDNFQLGLQVGETIRTGYFSIMEMEDLGTSTRSPVDTSADPVLRIYSSDATEALDYGERYHNQTDYVIGWGNGACSFDDNGTETSRFDWDGTASNTAFLLLDPGGTMRRVLASTNDSAGGGFRQLMILNE